jgi:predicted Zn-dependent peptidase
MPLVRSVAVGFWVGVGSRDEPAAIAGASHFLEHLLFKGTPARSAREVAEVIDAVGGEINAFTTKDHTAFYLRVLDRDLPVALDVLCDIMWNPAFRPGEFEAERQVILEELLTRGDDPEDLVQELLSEAMYPNHPLGREVLGNEVSVAALALDDLRGFHAARYVPGAMVLAAAGALDHERLVAEVEARFARTGRLPGGSQPDRTPPGVPVSRVLSMRRRTEQAHLAIGIPSTTRHDADRHAVTLLSQVLGGGVSSRLFQEIRETRGLAYSVYAYRFSYDDAGALVVYAGTAPGRAEELGRVVAEELDRLADGVADRELEIARGNIIGSLALGLEDSGARMARIGRSLLLHGEVPSIDDVVERYLGVTSNDMARVAAGIAAAPRAMAVIGPFKKSELAWTG